MKTIKEDQEEINKWQKEIDQIGKGPKKRVMKQLLNAAKNTIKLQKEYEALRPKLPEDEQKRLDEMFGYLI